MQPELSELSEIVAKARANPDTNPEDLAAAEAVLSAPEAITTPAQLSEEPKAAPTATLQPSDEGTKDIRAQIAEMTPAQKIKLALYGNSVCRMLLVLDASRMIQQFVLKNPKITISEIESFAKNTQVSEWVLRSISDSKSWMKSNNMKFILVNNPKTPGDIALKWLRYLPVSDLRKIAKSKNLPQLVAVTAKKRLADMEKE